MKSATGRHNEASYYGHAVRVRPLNCFSAFHAIDAGEMWSLHRPRAAMLAGRHFTRRAADGVSGPRVDDACISRSAGINVMLQRGLAVIRDDEIGVSSMRNVIAHTQIIRVTNVDFAEYRHRGRFCQRQSPLRRPQDSEADAADFIAIGDYRSP